MNKILIATLAFSTVLVSCSTKNSSSNATANRPNNIILGAYDDIRSTPTLDLNKLKGLPPIVNLRDKMSIVKNQSDRGTCSIFGTAALIEAAVKIDLNKEINVSEEYIQYGVKTDGYFTNAEGSSVVYNIQSIRGRGLLLEKDLSYQPSWFSKGLPCQDYKLDENPPGGCISHNAPSANILAKKLSATGLTFGSLPKNTNSIIQFLATKRRPLTVDVLVNFNGWPQDGNVYHNEALRAECLLPENEHNCGAHVILLTGYDLNKKVFFFKNSWGTTWGDGGFGTITFDSIDRYVASELYFASAAPAFKIPADYNVDPLKLTQFGSESKITDAGIDVSYDVKASGTKGRLMYISTFLSSKSKSLTDLPGDTNTPVLAVTAAEKEQLKDQAFRALTYVYSGTEDTIKTADGVKSHLVIPAEKLNIDSVTNLFNSSDVDTFMRTTIYVHTDTESYKVLKRIYSPIKK
jgi:C1A family cysteine protease